MSNHRNRPADAIREIEIIPNYLKFPEGSALIRLGDTIVVCTASVEDRVKDWLRGKGKGWITAEYAMLPRANDKRGMREGQFGRWPSGRSQEIQRLIGRALRSCVWPARLGEKTITIDCDVLQGDGGTRTASITGGFVALALALDRLTKESKVKRKPLRGMMAAVSVGMVGDEMLLDLNYKEDSGADVDLNVAADENLKIVELQGTSEGKPYDAERYHAMTMMALSGVKQLIQAQAQVLASCGVDLNLLVESPEALK